MKKSERRYSCQLAVIGSGLAGFAASVFALEQGMVTAQVGSTGSVAYTTGYLDLLGIPLAAGRYFQSASSLDDASTDDSGDAGAATVVPQFVLNERAVLDLGWESAEAAIGPGVGVPMSITLESVISMVKVSGRRFGQTMPPMPNGSDTRQGPPLCGGPRGVEPGGFEPPQNRGGQGRRGCAR